MLVVLLEDYCINQRICYYCCARKLYSPRVVLYKRVVIAMLIKDWQFSFSNCDLVNPPLVHDLEQNVASYFNPLFNRTNRIWLFLSLYSSLDYTSRKPLSCIQARGGLLRGRWIVSPMPVNPCQFKLYPLGRVTWKWPGSFIPLPMSDLSFA